VSWQKLTLERSWKLERKLGGNRIVGLMTAGFPRRKPCNGAVLPGAALFLAPGDSNSFNPVVYVLYETRKAPSVYMLLVFGVHYPKPEELLDVCIATFVVQNLGRKIVASNRSMKNSNARDVIWKHCQLKSLEHVPVGFPFVC
jgi:hypothetical protein